MTTWNGDAADAHVATARTASAAHARNARCLIEALLRGGRTIHGNVKSKGGSGASCRRALACGGGDANGDDISVENVPLTRQEQIAARPRDSSRALQIARCPRFE